MSTLTPNYNLKKPDSSDPFGDFRSDYNDNMDIIDANLGGGGGGGGHTIVDENGSDMPAESKLQFTGNVSVTDDNVNGATVVDVLGGGGNVYGAFIDPNRVIASGSIPQGSSTYTATEDCALLFSILSDSNNSAKIEIDGVVVWVQYDQYGINEFANYLFVKSGQTVTFTQSYSSSGTYKAYGLTQGTNGIFAPVIYSDNERVIGVWRDNKPLYQRILTLTQDTTLVADTWVKTEFNKDTMETLVRVDASIGTSGAVVEALSGGFIDGKLALNSARNVGLNVSDNARIIVHYTKTTDVAGSGNWNTDGVPTHHYSTSEQVIGTYFGKPLYEKTWDNLSIGIDGTNWVYFNDPVDIENVIKFDAYYNNTDRYLHCAISEYQRSNSNGIMFSGFNGMNRTVNRIVAQYTKTTD